MSGFTNTIRNQLVDWFFRGEAMTPPTSIWVAICSTAPTAGTGGTEFTGTGYARQEIPCTLTDWSGTQAAGSTTASTGTTGTTRNNAKVDFGDAGSSWGLASHWEAWTAETGGTRLFFGEIVNDAGTPTPRSISINDPVSFPISALSVTIP